MRAIPKSQILGMTELQKISAKRLHKLKKSGAPLLVMDKKSAREIFVILDWENYERLQSASTRAEKITPPPLHSQTALKALDFAERGLFWDRGDMKNADFIERLTNSNHREHAWAVTRLFERLKSSDILKIFGWEGARELLQKNRLRPAFMEPWQHAFEFRDQKTRGATRHVA